MHPRFLLASAALLAVVGRLWYIDMVAAIATSAPHVRAWEDHFLTQLHVAEEYLASGAIPMATRAAAAEAPPEPITPKQRRLEEETDAVISPHARHQLHPLVALPSVHPSRLPSRPALPASAKGKPLVTLCMIVKNERASLVSTLNSVLGHVDRYSILDTGSTDGSLELMEAWFRTHLDQQQEAEAQEGGDRQWQLHRGPFVDFSTTRNEALRLAGSASEFVLFLNGDDRLVHGARMRRWLEERRWMRGIEEEMYIVPISYGGITVGRSERISRASNHFVPDWPRDAFRHWKYEGVTHEVYVSQAALQGGVEIMYVPDYDADDGSGSGGGGGGGVGFGIYHDITYDTASAKRARFQLDVVLLKKELQDQDHQQQQQSPSSHLASHPGRPRTLYYLAQSYYNLGQHVEAFRWFARRLEVDYPRKTPEGRDNEKAKAAGMMASIGHHLGKTPQEIGDLLTQAWQHCPSSYAALQLAKFYAAAPPPPSTSSTGERQKQQQQRQREDCQLAEKYARVSRDYLVNRKTAVLCGDDPQLVSQQLPQLFERLAIHP